VRIYLAGLPASEGKAAYKHLVQALQGPQVQAPPGMRMDYMGNPMPMQRPEMNAFVAEDVIGLAAAAPRGLDHETIVGLGAILRTGLEGRTVAAAVVTQFKTELSKGPGKAALTTRQAGQLLMEAGEPVAAGAFLPTLEEALAQKDAEGLNLLARHFVGLHA